MSTKQTNSKVLLPGITGRKTGVNVKKLGAETSLEDWFASSGSDVSDVENQVAFTNAPIVLKPLPTTLAFDKARGHIFSRNPFSNRRLAYESDLEEDAIDVDKMVAPNRMARSIDGPPVSKRKSISWQLPSSDTGDDESEISVKRPATNVTRVPRRKSSTGSRVSMSGSVTSSSAGSTNDVSAANESSFDYVFRRDSNNISVGTKKFSLGTFDDVSAYASRKDSVLENDNKSLGSVYPENPEVEITYDDVSMRSEAKSSRFDDISRQETYGNSMDIASVGAPSTKSGRVTAASEKFNENTSMRGIKSDYAPMVVDGANSSYDDGMADATSNHTGHRYHELMSIPEAPDRMSSMLDVPNYPADEEYDSEPVISTKKKSRRPAVQLTQSDTEEQPAKPNNHRKKTKNPQLELKIYQKGGLREEETEDGQKVKRSARMRYKPLEYWRNEHVKFGRRKSGNFPVPVIQEIVRVPDEEKKRSKSKKSRSGYKVEIDPVVTVVDPFTEELVDEDIIHPPVEPKFKESKHGTFKLAKLLADPFNPNLCAGMMSFPKGSEKPIRNSGNITTVCYVLSGEIEVTINETTVIMPRGSSFLIPKRNHFKISNNGSRESRVFFVNDRSEPVQLENEND